MPFWEFKKLGSAVREIGRLRTGVSPKAYDFLKAKTQESQHNKGYGRQEGVSDASKHPGKVRFTSIHSPLDKVLQREQKWYHSSFVAKELSFNQWRDQLNEAAKNITKDTKVWTCCTPEALEAILTTQNESERRFKSLFETKSSQAHGINSIRNRTVNERNFANYAKDLDPKQRIIYGYLSDDNQGYTKKVFAWEEHPLDRFGSVRVCFNDEVKQRTSFMVGDTMDIEDLIAKPVPYESPNGDCFPLFNIDGTFKNVNDIPTPVSPYLEAQIHYGVHASDIKKVVLPEENRELVSMLELHHIEYEFAYER